MTNRSLMMKNSILSFKSIAVAGLISLTALASYHVSALPFGGEAGFSQGMHKGKKVLKRMARYLALTDEQLSEIKTIKAQSKTEGETLKEQMLSLQQFKDEAKLLKDNEVFDEQAFTELYQKHSDTFASMALLRAKTKHQIFHVLTPEQQEKWQEAKEKRRQKRLEKRHAN